MTAQTATLKWTEVDAEGTSCAHEYQVTQDNFTGEWRAHFLPGNDPAHTEGLGAYTTRRAAKWACIKHHRSRGQR